MLQILQNRYVESFRPRLACGASTSSRDAFDCWRMPESICSDLSVEKDSGIFPPLVIAKAGKSRYGEIPIGF